VRALCTDAGRGLRPAKPVVGHAAQLVQHCGLVAVGRARAVRIARRLSSISAQKPFKKLKIHFYFSFGFKLNSNFKILYLNIQSFKNYEISSVGFIIFWYIQ
jgi:hypothetical protein